jgi:tetratricopeptide (TPR) repeat protein
MNGRVPLAITLGLLVLAVSLLVGLRQPVLRSLDQMRTEYVALGHLNEAFLCAHSRPARRQEAISHMDRALALGPSQPNVVGAAAEIYVAAGAYDRALQVISKQMNPNPYLLAQCRLHEGKVREGTQILVGIGRAASRALETRRSDDPLRAATAMELNNAGYLLADAGVALPEARRMLETAVDVLPLDVNCVDSLGWLFYRTGDYRRATFYLERAVRLQSSPAEPELLYHLGAAYARQGDRRRAVKMLTKAQALDPEHPEVRRELRTMHWLLPSPAMAGAESAAS